MATVEEVESVNSNGALVVRLPVGKPEVYEITKIPLASASLVQDARKDILTDLDLKSVITDLNRTSDLLYLAYLGVIGTGVLQANISKRQKKLSDLCGDCLVTMRAMQEGSHAVLLKLIEAYKYLLLAKEQRALVILGRCATVASSMSTHCGDLAASFGVLKEDTAKDADAAIIALSEHDHKVKELESLRRDWTANKKKQEEMTKNLNKDIEELKTEIAKEEARADEAEKRALVGQIIGAIAGAIGGGLGAYMNPVGRMIPKTGASMPGGSEGSGDSKPSPDLQQKEKALGEKTSAEKALDDAATAEAQARAEVSTVAKQVFDAKALTASKQTLLDNAKAAHPVDEQKVTEAQTALDASSKTLSKLEADKTKAEEGLKQALKSKSHAADVLNGAAAALQDIVGKVDKYTDGQSAQAKELNSRRISMVDQKRNLEMLRLESVGQLAELTSRLESSTEEISMEKSAQTALEIATWALDNIFVSLSNAKFFWDRMTEFCKKLASSELTQKINDELEFSTPEERVEFYKSLDFVRLAISYLAKWTALTNVCAEYVQGSADARRAVLEHIKTSPNAKEAKELLPILKEKLKNELGLDAAESNVHIDNLDAESKRLKEAYQIDSA